MSDDDTLSVNQAFDMPEYNLHGLRIYIGCRREASVDGEDPLTSACECRAEWVVGDAIYYSDVDEEDAERIDLGSDRGFIHPDTDSFPAEQMGQAIDLALRMIETPKSIDIMTGVAQRLVAQCPGEVHQITPNSTWDQIQTLVKAWIAKLRQDEFFKIQAVPRANMGGKNSMAQFRLWSRFVGRDRELATLADYKPHNAGMLQIDAKIIDNLFYHADSNHPHSPIERQKCLFHVANLIINQVQKFWVAFLIDNLARPGSKDPFAVYSEATEGFYDVYNGVNAGYHWDGEFFGGVVSMWHNTGNPVTEFNQHGGFGRIRSIGDAYLNYPDGSEQLVSIESITRCNAYDFSDVCQNGLRVVGPRVPAFGFPFVVYDGSD